MSSDTNPLQERYDAEKHRALRFEKKIAMLEREVERLVGSEVASDLKDEKLRAKDATIQELQTALDNTDRPILSDDGKKVHELQEKIKLLESTSQQTKKLLEDSMKSNWSSLKSLVEQHYVNDRIAAISQTRGLMENIKSAKADMKSVKAELTSVKAELSESQALNRAMARELQTLIAESKNHTSIQEAKDEQLRDLAADAESSHLAAIANAASSRLKLGWHTDRIERKFGSLLSDLQQVDQDAGSELSKGQDTGPSTNKTFCGPGGSDTLRSGSLPQAEPARNTVEQELSENRDSTAKCEMLRLKDRQTLHRLAPS